jgi:hypothetical protein
MLSFNRAMADLGLTLCSKQAPCCCHFKRKRLENSSELLPYITLLGPSSPLRPSSSDYIFILGSSGGRLVHVSQVNAVSLCTPQWIVKILLSLGL